MRKAIVFLVIMVMLMGTGSVWAAGEQEEVMTRGDFAAMLVEAARIQGELPPAELLVKKGIMLGYPDGGMYLDQVITRMEAVALTAKTLGLDAGINPPPGVSVPLDPDHWGYNFYGWFIRQGLVSGDPADVLTVAAGTEFLNNVFSVDPEALEILERAQATVTDHNKLRVVINGRMEMVPREGVEGAEEFSQIAIEMGITQESILPDRIHQMTTIVMALPGEEPLEMATEVYIADGAIFQQMPDPDTGEMMWFRFPDIPGLEEMLQQQTELPTEIIPAGMEDFLHYKLLGTTEINGEEVYIISFYGRVDDFDKFLEVALAPFSDGQQLQQAIAPIMDIIDSMSYWGIEYVGVEDLLVRKGDFTSIVLYAEELLGQPMPLEAARMFMEIEEYSYDDSLVIEVPEEVLAAPELDLGIPLELEAPELPIE